MGASADHTSRSPSMACPFEGQSLLREAAGSPPTAAALSGCNLGAAVYHAWLTPLPPLSPLLQPAPRCPWTKVVLGVGANPTACSSISHAGRTCPVLPYGAGPGLAAAASRGPCSTVAVHQRSLNTACGGSSHNLDPPPPPRILFLFPMPCLWPAGVPLSPADAIACCWLGLNPSQHLRRRLGQHNPRGTAMSAMSVPAPLLAC
jgi:hypothetical protein